MSGAPSLTILMSLPRAGLAGGPATHLPLLRAGLEQAGVNVICFNYMRRSDYETWADKVWGRTVDLVRFIYLTLKHRPDLVHHNSAFDEKALVRDGLLCAVAWLLRIPIIVKIHGSHRSAFGQLSMLCRSLRHLVINCPAGIGVLSAEEREEFIAHWPHIKDRVHVVKNIVRDDFLRAEVVDQERQVVYFTSRFIREKGIFDLLNAVPETVEIFPNCRFAFIGSGPDVDAFRRRVRELGLGTFVSYLGGKSYAELIDMYRSGGVFVFPTHFPEGMPMALVESLAVGLLAISSPIRFIKHVPSFEKYPHLVLDGKESMSEQIACALKRVLGDHGLRKEVGVLNKDFAREYSADAVVQEFVLLYQTLLQKQARA